MSLFHKNKSTLKETILITLIILVTGYVGMHFQKRVDENNILRQELEKARAEVVYVEPDDIEAYISYIFGSDAPKAMLLLKGRDGKCAENRTLKWDAQNYNVDGSMDVGVFQINSKWQKTQVKFLYNWRVNILIAKQLFDESDSFKLWSCGKFYNI